MRGFTLLESLLYLGLFSLVLSAGWTSMAAFSSSASRTSTLALLATERLYLMQKIQDEIQNQPLSTGGIPLPPLDSDVSVQNFLFSLEPIASTSAQEVSGSFDLIATTSMGQVLTQKVYFSSLQFP